MSKNTWDAFAGCLAVIDFIGGWVLVGVGFVLTFTSPVYGWLEIAGGIFLLAHFFTLLNSQLEEK